MLNSDLGASYRDDEFIGQDPLLRKCDLKECWGRPSFSGSDPKAEEFLGQGSNNSHLPCWMLSIVQVMCLIAQNIVQLLTKHAFVNGYRGVS